MAVTGLMLFGYVVAHMLGNLQLFGGPAGINHYAEFLHTSTRRLWWARAVLSWRSRCTSGRRSAERAEGRGPARAATARRRTGAPPGLPHMIWSGLRARRVHRLPHPALHDRHRAPRLRPGRRLPQLRRGLQGTRVVAGLLHRRDGIARAAPAPRRRGASPDARGRHPRYIALRPGLAGVVAIVVTRASRLPSPCSPASSSRRPPWSSTANIPAGPHREEVGQAPLRDEAGQPGQQAQVHGHRRRHRPGRRRGARPPRPSSATTSTASASRTARAAPTPSPPRAASTPPRTTRTTATASTASSTTPSRAATSAPARPTSTGWRRSA